MLKQISENSVVEAREPAFEKVIQLHHVELLITSLFKLHLMDSQWLMMMMVMTVVWMAMKTAIGL